MNIGRALGDHGAAAFAAFRAHVNDIVRRLDHIQIALDMGRGLKSTQQKMERQEERDRKVAFFENQKENLKNVKCETVEEIARKLEMFQSYEDQIKAAKMAYNNEQMMHMMDESQEIGEKIAEAVEKSKPKTNFPSIP